MNKLVLAAAVATLMTGCATKEYVNEQVASASASANKRMDGQQADMSSRMDRQAREANTRYDHLDGRVSDLQNRSNTISQTAQEALERAKAAGKLAEGKFMYETALSSQIGFELNSNELNEDGKKALDELVARLKADNKNVYLEIQGHTDSSGSEDANLRLSQKRAEAVYRYLAISGGLALHRMNVMAYGESAPVADNKTRAGRVENRRVTVVVLQ